MCMGAAIQARIGRLVYGCPDPKGGAVESLHALHADPRLNHRIAVTRGIEAERARARARLLPRTAAHAASLRRAAVVGIPPGEVREPG